MARKARGELFSSDEIAVVHVMNQVHHGEYLMGWDEKSQTDFSYRRIWMEKELERVLRGFAIDLLAEALMDNHFHLILRSRPDVVQVWDDRQVARQWLLICPNHKRPGGDAEEPTDDEIQAICSDKELIDTYRSQLSDISWLVRLVCQRVAQRVNGEKLGPGGALFNGRFGAVRLVDDQSLLACSVYVDLNPIRAAICELVEGSKYSSMQKRLRAMAEKTDVRLRGFSLAKLYAQEGEACLSEGSGKQKISADEKAEVDGWIHTADGMLAPLSIDEQHDPIGPHLSQSTERCSDKGYLPIRIESYIELLDWTARLRHPDKRGSTPESAPPILERLNLEPEQWCLLTEKFEDMFSLVAGMPASVDQARGKIGGHRYHMKSSTRALLSGPPAAKSPPDLPSSTNDSAQTPHGDSQTRDSETGDSAAGDASSVNTESSQDS